MKIKLSYISLSLMMAFCSCSDFLDVKPEGTPNEGNFWASDADYEKAVVAIYDCMGLEETWGRDLFWEQGASDDIFYSRSRGNSQMNLANLNMDGTTEGSIKNIYNIMYETIAKCNNIINHALKVTDRSDVINRSLGEAYFMRAFSHYLIAYRYGRVDNGVPFDRYEDYDPYPDGQIPVQRASVLENYQLIIEDLEQAASLLPWFNNYTPEEYGRATRDAAIGLKVKTYAYWAQHDAGKWALIPDLVDKLENEAGRGLLDNFEDVFIIANEWGKEHIWSVNSQGSNYSGSIFPSMVLDNKGWGRYNGWGNFKPTIELLAEYDENDLRKKATIMEYGDEFVFFGETRRFSSSADLECGMHFRKYMEPFSYGSVDPSSGAGISSVLSSNGNRPTTDLNLPIIRFAEMLLFKAEALIEQGRGSEAAAVLNRISHRAGLGNLYTDATIYDLMHERRCELACEFTDRVMDLKRWAAKYPIAKTRLEAAKHGFKYQNRSDPDSELDLENSTTMTINGKTYQGVIEIMAAKTYNADKDCVLPYEQNEVIRAQGALTQNPGY